MARREVPTVQWKLERLKDSVREYVMPFEPVGIEGREILALKMSPPRRRAQTLAYDGVLG